MGNEVDHNTPTCDLDRFKDTALTRRELAWALLKETRNPVYVGMRYGYDLETMEKALETIPESKSIYKQVRANREVAARVEPREPGSDDESP